MPLSPASLLGSFLAHSKTTSTPPKYQTEDLVEFLLEDLDAVSKREFWCSALRCKHCG